MVQQCRASLVSLAPLVVLIGLLMSQKTMQKRVCQMFIFLFFLACTESCRAELASRTSSTEDSSSSALDVVQGFMDHVVAFDSNSRSDEIPFDRYVSHDYVLRLNGEWKSYEDYVKLARSSRVQNVRMEVLTDPKRKRTKKKA